MNATSAVNFSKKWFDFRTQIKFLPVQNAKVKTPVRKFPQLFLLEHPVSGFRVRSAVVAVRQEALPEAGKAYPAGCRFNKEENG